MIRTTTNQTLWRMRLLRKDLGVALITLLALGLGLLLMLVTEGRMRSFSDSESGLSLLYPASWSSADSLLDVLLKVENPLSDSTFKTVLNVESREIDLADPPTLQTLLDRRVEERGQLTAYQFLGQSETDLAGARAIVAEYAYVVQPIDQARRAALPVVVHAREYIVLTTDRSFYITLAAADSEFAQADAQFAQVLRSVRLP